MQAASRRKRDLQPVPGSSLAEDARVTKPAVLASLRGGLSFYEGLQVPGPAAAAALSHARVCHGRPIPSGTWNSA